jgi:CRISPR system Cascade subunit CasB
LLSQDDKTGDLANLRRGLGQPPGTVAQMYRYVIPWLPKNATQTTENAYYLIASLFSLHTAYSETGNLGDHLAQTISQGGEDAVERRFIGLLSAHEEDLPDYLRQVISYLKSKGIPVNWDQLFTDILNWQSPNRRVQKSWARSFWGTRQETNPIQQSENSATN